MSWKNSDSSQKNRATAAIWGCAVGMFAICIPLTAIAESGAILPILVLLAAGGGTAAVWLAPDKRYREDRLTIKALEERIMTLEAIYTSLPDVEKPPQLLKTDKY